MNAGKSGGPFELSESLTEFIAVWYTYFHLPNRQTEGAAGQVAEFFQLPKSAE